MHVCSVSTNNFRRIKKRKVLPFALIYIGCQSQFLLILQGVNFETLLTLFQITFLGVGSVNQLRNMNIFADIYILTIWQPNVTFQC